MKIGIVSKESHAKSHYAALTRKGYEVSLLGGNPNDIPPSIDVLVVRDASCSTHSRLGGLQWGRDTGKPVIMQNGLSGILRDLKELQDAPKAPTPEAAIQFDELESIIKEARGLGRGIAHIASRYDMDTGGLVRELRSAGLYQKTIVALAPPMEDAAITARTYLDLLLEERPNDPFDEQVDAIHLLMDGSLSREDLVRAVDPFPSPYPSDASWAKAVPEGRLRREILHARRFSSDLSDEAGHALEELLVEARYMTDFSWDSDTLDTLRGVGRNPIRVVAVLAAIVDGCDSVLNRKMIGSLYKELFGVGMDMRNADAVAWVFGTTIAFQVPPKPAPKKRRGLRQISGEPPRPTTNPTEIPALEQIGVLSAVNGPNPIPPKPDVAHLMEEIVALRDEVSRLREQVAASDSDEIARLRAEVQDLKGAYTATRLNSAITFDEILASVVAAGAVIQITPKTSE
jgi:hypothetical protein